MAESLKSSVVFALRHLSVELIVFLVYLGYVFSNTFQQPAIYKRICETYYWNDTRYYCARLLDVETEIQVQRRSAEWALYSSLAYLSPAIFADTILGAYGDKFGWKTPIVVGVFGVAVSELGYLLTLSSTVATPYWTTLLFLFVAGLTGSVSILPVACNAFLAEITEDSDLLTVRAAIFSAFQTMASVLGGFGAALLYPAVSVVVSIDVELALLLLAIIFALWRIPQRPMQRQHSYSLGTIEERPRETLGTRVKHFLGDIMLLLHAGIHTYSRERPGSRRAFLFVTLAALVLSFTTLVETTSVSGGVINSYVFRRELPNGLDWQSDDLGYWNGAGYFILAVGTIFGTWAMKRLGFRETTLMLVGTASAGVRVLLIGIASNDAMMYVANMVGVFSGLVQPAGISFLVQLVAPSEVGKAFSLLGIGGDLAYLVVSAFYAIVYRFSVDVHAGTVFLIMSSLHLLMFIALLWAHVRSGREGVGRRRFTSVVTNAISRLGSPQAVAPTPEGRVNRMNVSTVFTPNGYDPNSKPKRKLKQLSIHEHAEEIENRGRLERGLWESEEDIRRTRMSQPIY